jgi:hypothetical protein
MHLEVRVFFERGDRHERATVAEGEPIFRAAIAALVPAGADDGGDVGG